MWRRWLERRTTAEVALLLLLLCTATGALIVAVMLSID
jgi:hypothetical protein